MSHNVCYCAENRAVPLSWNYAPDTKMLGLFNFRSDCTCYQGSLSTRKGRYWFTITVNGGGCIPIQSINFHSHQNARTALFAEVRSYGWDCEPVFDDYECPRAKGDDDE